MKKSTERLHESKINLYRITVQETVGTEMGYWFEGMDFYVKDGHTVLEGKFVDQSELQGLLRKIHDLHLTLISVERIEDDK